MSSVRHRFHVLCFVVHLGNVVLLSPRVLWHEDCVELLRAALIDLPVLSAVCLVIPWLLQSQHLTWYDQQITDNNKRMMTSK